jgi:rod shape-determining protein MreC
MIADSCNDSFHRARSSFSVIVVPIQYLVDFPIAAVNWVVDDISSQHHLIKENTKLQAEVSLLNAKLQKHYAIEFENQQLKALLQSSTKTVDKVSVAQLLAVAPSPFIRQVVLDKGSKHGVFVGQPVLDANGIMGQVIQVGSFTSLVILITDTKSAIPVQINRNGVRAIAVGDGALNVLKLKNVPNTTDIREGDVLITSGLGEHYPFGYPVGKIISIEHSSGEQFANITIAPAAHLSRSRLVLLVWPYKQKIEPAIKQTLFSKGSKNSSTKEVKR